jgi:hypothetical protein
VWYVKCSKCGEKSKFIRKESAGVFLIISAILLVTFFGINTGTVIYSLLMALVGGSWIISKASKNYVCNACTRH